MRLAPDGKLSTFRMPANIPNGMVMDPDDGLIVCEVGDPNAGLPPRLTRIDVKTGAVKVLADNYGGRRLKTPKRCHVRQQGAASTSRATCARSSGPLPCDTDRRRARGGSRHVGVYRIDRDGTVKRLLQSPQIRRPNGIMVAPDDRTLYVIENDINPNGLRRLLAFDLADDGATSNARVLRDFYPGRSADGMTVDVKGNLYVVAGLNRTRGTSETLDTRAGVYVMTPEGKELRFIPIPEDTPTNITFAGRR